MSKAGVSYPETREDGHGIGELSSWANLWLALFVGILLTAKTLFVGILPAAKTLFVGILPSRSTNT